MPAYWVQFQRLRPVCIEASDIDTAEVLAGEISGEPAAFVNEIPYPSEPRIGKQSGIPSFCYRPMECLGKSSCPQAHACND